MKTTTRRHALATKLTDSIGKPPDMSASLAELDEYVVQSAQTATKELDLKPFTKSQLVLLTRLMRQRVGMTNRLALQQVTPEMMADLIAALAAVEEPEPTAYNYNNMPCDDLVDAIIDIQGDIDRLNRLYADQCGGGLDPNGNPPPAVVAADDGNELPPVSSTMGRCGRMANVIENHENDLSNAYAAWSMRCGSE